MGPASRPVSRPRNSAAAGGSSQRILGFEAVGLAGQLNSLITMLKAVLVLFMVAYCLSNPKHFLIETKDQPGSDNAGDISTTNHHADVRKYINAGVTDGNDYSILDIFNFVKSGIDAIKVIKENN